MHVKGGNIHDQGIEARHRDCAEQPGSPRVMVISLIAAMAEGRILGRDNQLPWRLPADLKRFRAITWGKPVLMGRKTFDSIGRPLPGRLNVLLTRDVHYRTQGCLVVHSLAQAMEACAGSGELMVIGGASVYEQVLPLVQRMYLTLIHHTFPGDVYFPDFHYDAWRETQRIECQPDGDNPYRYTFVVLERRFQAGRSTFT